MHLFDGKKSILRSKNCLVFKFLPKFAAFYRGPTQFQPTKISFCSRHKHQRKIGLFALEKIDIGLFQRTKSAIIRSISISSRGDPRLLQKKTP
jgi:hypothetical protein